MEQALPSIRGASPVETVHLVYLVAGFVLGALCVYVWAQYAAGHKLNALSREAPGHATSVRGFKLDAAEKGRVHDDRKLWSSESVFDIEKRAVLSKTWLYVTHQSRFTKPGDYLTFALADFSYFLILGKDNKIRAFHNICRHRAYTVVRKSIGTSLKLTCKYHGWQYESTGELVKAPKFDQESGFDLSQNGLFEIPLAVTEEGLIFVNFDNTPSRTPQPPRVDAGGACIDERDYWRDGWELEGRFNYKLGMISDVDHSNDSRGRLRQIWDGLPGRTSDTALVNRFTRVRRLDNNTRYTMKLVPMSANKTWIRVDVYSREAFIARKNPIETIKNIARQQLATLEDAHKALVAGDVIARHALLQNSNVLEEIQEAVRCHQEAERLAGRKIQPAAVAVRRSIEDEEAVAVCDKLDGMTSTPSDSFCLGQQALGGKLEW